MSMAGKLHPEAAGPSIAMTVIELTDGSRLDADGIAFDAPGRALLAPGKDHLAEGKGAIMENAVCEMMSPGSSASVNPSILSARQVEEVACVKQPVACFEVSSDSGISAYSKRGTRSMGSSLKFYQVWVFLLIILASSKQVLSSAAAKREIEEIGTCRFDLTSLAMLSCVEPDGNWNPPSASCCKALLYAIDNLPDRNESGACCLCCYLSKKYSSHALSLAKAYVMCQGKDSHTVTVWSSLPLHCYKVCRRENAYGIGTPILKDFPVGGVEGTQSGYFQMLLWIAIVGAAAFSIVILVRFCYHWKRRPIMPSNLQNQGLPNEIREDEHRASGKKSSAHRRMSSSRGSPNG